MGRIADYTDTRFQTFLSNKGSIPFTRSTSDRWCVWASPNGFEASPSLTVAIFVPTEEETEADRQATIDGNASKLGVTLAIVGTLVWVDGDLIGGLPQSVVIRL